MNGISMIEKPCTTPQQAAAAASGRIAPTWPLDQLIAVNPWWEMRDQPLATVSARLSVLNEVKCLMPRSWYRERWQREITPGHLQMAVHEAGETIGERELLAWLEGDDLLPHWHNFSDQVDAVRDLHRHMSWHDEIVHQISQFCAYYFSADTPLAARVDNGLYAAWLEAVRSDRGIEIAMGEGGLAQQFRALPDTAAELLDAAVQTLGVGPEGMADYFHALLLDINGWASWVAYLRWQARLAGTESDPGPELVAIRLAWELAVWRHIARREPGTAALLERRWQQQFERLPHLLHQHREAQRPAWIWQRAAEMAYQQALHERLLQAVPAAVSAPALQAVFCIDVRSEVYRRALEAQDRAIQTLGFAGFFGLPLAYTPAGADYVRPQLPGLLAPALCVTETADESTRARRSGVFNRRARWEALGRKAPAAFGFIEALGLGYALKLLRNSFRGAAPAHPVNSASPANAHFCLRAGGAPLAAAAQAELAAGILRAMSLTAQFAPVVMLVGHGSSTRNNPHAAGLDCGACGGQTGEINVRVLAQILNTPEVRNRLASSHGIAIPEDTHFVPALHDTTTDDIHCLGTLPDGASHIAGWLEAAGTAARRERAVRLGVDPARSERAIRSRSRDWSQVRPEWGLAGNGCFVVAPRARTRHLDFGGRSFLHDYDWRADAGNGYGTLELIMTAPMVVTHWINMQYNASVSDNARYGSGNKVLHNVVGGHLGVFEGNGGDLRIGLPLQSLHDGADWVHQPLRLSVYLAAPREAIAAIVARHEVVCQLVDNDWLHLFQLDDDAGEIHRLYRGEWSLAAQQVGSMAA